MTGISSCSQAAHLLPATRRRLLADLKRLQEEPVPLAAAQPHSDEDLTLWDGMIGVEMSVTHIGQITVPLHFLIDFPADYPQSAPNIGFSFDFDYRGGANYIMQDGRLKGKKVICLDVLGNFGGIHTEWKDSVGSGWSPAYSVTTLLVQLQSVLCDTGVQMSQEEQDRCYQSAMRFCEKNPSSVLQLMDEDDVKEQRRMRNFEATLARACSGKADLQAKLLAFAKRKFLEDSEGLEQFAELISEVHAAVAVAGTAAPHSSKEVATAAAPVDTNIVCFSTGKLYTEAMLGVGVRPEKRNLFTAAELLSKEAFDGGLRQGTDKATFTYFLPVWINKAHAAESKKWQAALASSYRQIGQRMYEVSEDDDAILEVFPRLINQMIVEVMRPDASKSAAIATFEALCNFWRTLRWLVDERRSLRGKMAKRLNDFTSREEARHKDVTPDLGLMLVMYTVMQGHEACPAQKDFIQAYADENSLRWVMWWQRSGTKPEATAVFEATRVSREICMFQMMVVELIIGDVQETLQEMEATNCKLPARLEKMQQEWRKRKANTETWKQYFDNIGAQLPTFPSVAHWIESCVQRAAMKGPKYVDGRGGGKGTGKKGNGKGHKQGYW